MPRLVDKEMDSNFVETENDTKEVLLLYYPFLRLCMLYAVIMSSNVILAAMLWLGVPSHLFWIKVTIEDILQLYFISSLRKMKKIWTLDGLKYDRLQDTTIDYSMENVVFYFLRGKCFRSSKRESNDNAIEKMKKESVIKRIELTMWLVLQNESLMAYTVLEMFLIFILNALGVLKILFTLSAMR